MSEKLTVGRINLGSGGGFPRNAPPSTGPNPTPPKPERSGLAYEIEKLEAKLTKKMAQREKIIKAMELKLAQMETMITKIGSWVANKLEQEAQAGLEQKPQLSQVDQSGETWLKRHRPSECRYCKGRMVLRMDGMLHCEECNWMAFRQREDGSEIIP